MKRRRPSGTTLDLAGVLARLGERVRASDLALLSDLPSSASRTLRDLWPQLPLDIRRRAIAEMVELSELNIALNFRQVFLVALDDIDPEVRIQAIQGLWEEEDTTVLRALLRVLAREDIPEVRAALAQALGRFADLAVQGRLSEELARELRTRLDEMLAPHEPVTVRRRALEAIAVYGDEEVQEAIDTAYWSGEPALRVSALYAMGRTLDRRWLPILLDELRSDDPEHRYEAAIACGELQAAEAVDDLIALTGDTDREVQGAAILALGRIGGPVATNVLRRLARSDDPFVREAAAEALAEAVFADDPLRPTPW